MKTLGERIKKARKNKDWSGQQLADALQLSSKQSISLWENNKGVPSNLMAVAEALDVPLTWLLGETEETEVPEKQNKQESSYLAKRIPYYDDISVFAGQMTTYQASHEVATDYIYIPEFSDCDASFPMFGDSMMSKLYPGETLLCKFIEGWREDILPFGQIFVVFTDELRVVKYVKRSKKDNHFLLVSENEHYEPFDVPKSKIVNMMLVKGTYNRLVL